MAADKTGKHQKNNKKATNEESQNYKDDSSLTNEEVSGEGFNKNDKNKNKPGNKSSDSSDVQDFLSGDGIEYLLFLIMILLLLGNQKSFNDYFRLLNSQTRELKNMLNVFESTAESLKSAIMTPQEMLNNK